jgi:hypothetical protein
VCEIAVHCVLYLGEFAVTFGQGVSVPSLLHCFAHVALVKMLLLQHIITQCCGCILLMSLLHHQQGRVCLKYEREGCIHMQCVVLGQSDGRVFLSINCPQHVHTAYVCMCCVVSCVCCFFACPLLWRVECNSRKRGDVCAKQSIVMLVLYTLIMSVLSVH